MLNIMRGVRKNQRPRQHVFLSKPTPRGPMERTKLEIEFMTSWIAWVSVRAQDKQTHYQSQVVGVS